MKKVFALLLSALMICALVPAAVFAKTGPETKSFPGAEYLNINGCMLYYSDSNTTYHCTGTTSGGRSYVQITNGGHANTTAGFGTDEIVCKQGDKLYFDYWYMTELGYDWFNFTAHQRNGSDVQVLHLSGENGGNDTSTWTTFCYEIPSTGWYSFRWEYVKDGSNDYEDDCVRISRVYLNEHWNYQRAEAGTLGGTGLFEYDFYNNETYAFKAVTSTQSGHEMYLRSNNNGQSNSVAKFKISGQTRACTLKFDYAVDCEEVGSSGSYFDYFEVTVDGTSVLKIAGNYWANWYSEEVPLSQGWHDIEFKYVKDNSVNTSNDCAAVDNIRLIYPSNDAAGRWQDINYLGSSSKKVYFNTPYGSQAWGTKIDSNGSNLRGYSNNRYLDASSSFCETIINMDEGETLSFDYVISSEVWNDQLLFYVDGDLKMNADGWADRFWHSYTYTATTTGTYTFKWVYNKDGSVNDGWDYAYIRNVNYNGSYNASLNLDNLILSENSAPLHFITDPTYGHGFQPYCVGNGKDSSDDYAAISRNQYMENTDAVLTTESTFLEEGTLIYFDFFVDSEETYDTFNFKLMRGSTTVIDTELASGDYGWRYREFTIPQDGNYTLTWTYSKDISNNNGTDCAMVKNVLVERPMPSLDDALNSDETQKTLHFTTSGTYPFAVGASSNSYYAYSTNGGVNSSSSTMNSTTTFQQGDTLSFYYNIDSEENYDWFNFYINDQRVIHQSGEIGIQLYTWTAPSTGTYNLRWEYTKDSSTSSGNDCVMVMEVKVILNGGAPGHGNGDVDGNGSINVTDAVLALRHAMGIITLNAQQIARGDVDGNGSVNVTDAVTIMRKAMGLIP